MEEKRILLQGDVDAVKSYVFEAPGLPQIRGGSQRLVECENQVREYVEKEGGSEIYCSGGGFLFEVPADKAEEIKRGIESIYLKHTQVATVTVVYENGSEIPPVGPDIADGWAGRLVKAHLGTQQAGEFARRTAFLAARLRQAKLQKTTAPFIEAFPFGKRCDICGKRVAEETVPYPDETKRMCSVCYQRHETGREERKVWFERFVKALQLNLEPHVPQDLDDLVQGARRSYVAFVYADGNNIGGLLQRVKKQQEYQALSDRLRAGTERALFEALWEVCRPALEEKKRAWPFEIINVGGDDVTLLIQAGYAWEVALTFLKKFEQYVQWNGQSITASVGIAIADVKYPVLYLEALASDLLKRAKKVAREAQTSAIDFLWLPNAVAVTKAEMVADLYRRGDLMLTARPYTLAQAQKLQEVVTVLSQWPRSLRHRWGEALDRGKWSSLGLILYDLARRMSEKREEVDEWLDTFQELTRSLGSSTEVPLGYLWWEGREKDRVVWRTALLDVLELAELRAMRPDVEEGA